MEAATVKPSPAAAPNRRRLLLGVGPGLVFVLGSLGPRDLVANAIAGSTAGTRLLWVLAVGLMVRWVVLDSSARYVMATGESLLAGCGRLGRWVVLLWAAVAVLGRHLSALVRVTLLGTAAHILWPLPTPHSVMIWGIASWTAGFVLLFWGRYRGVEKLSKPLAAAMGACLVTAAVLSKPDLSSLVSGLLRPAMPLQKGIYSPALVIMSVLAASMGSFSNLRYAAYVHEKGWRSASHLRSQRVDMFVGVFGMFFMLVMLQLAAASALLPRGIQVKEVEDLIPMFSLVLGDAGRVLFGLTLWCVSFSGYVGNGAGYGILLSEVYHRINPPVERAGPGREDPGQSARLSLAGGLCRLHSPLCVPD